MASPLHQFEIYEIASLNVGGFEIGFTNHSLWMMIAVSLVSAILLWATRKPTLVPSRMQSLAELTYEFIQDLTFSNAGKNAAKFLPLVFTLFLFIASVNVIGMVPGAYTGTSQLLTTASLAFTVFAIVIVTGFYVQGLGFLGMFYPKGTPIVMAPLVVVLELISFFARPLTLALRLGANMIAGHILLKVFAGFSVLLYINLPAAVGIPASILPLGITFALTALEIMVALLQAYIFAILTCVYLHDALHGH